MTGASMNMMNDLPTKTAETPVEPIEFVALIEQQTRIYQALKRLGRRQRELVATEDPAPLLSLLGERQQLIGALTAISDRLGPLPRCWGEIRGRLPQAERSRCAGMLRLVQQNLREIIADDSQDAERLKLRKQGVARELGGIAARGAMLSAYRQGLCESTRAHRTDEQS